MPKIKSKNNKGSIVVLILIVIVGFAIALGGTYWITKSKYIPQRGYECVDKCGDGICQEIVCLSIDCPCSETTKTCPQDCEKDKATGWKTYRNEEYGFEFRYPEDWKNKEPDYLLDDNEATIQDFIKNPKITILNIILNKNVRKYSLKDFANREIKNNNCPAEFEPELTGCPEMGPVDHIIKENEKGILYSLYCSATSENYIYIIKDQKENIIRFSYYDDFKNDWCESKKIEKFNQILSTFKFIEPGETATKELLELPNLPFNIQLPNSYSPYSVKDEFLRSLIAAYDFNYDENRTFPYIGSIDIFSRDEIKRIQEECDKINESEERMPCSFYYTVEIYDKQKRSLPKKEPYEKIGDLTQETTIEYKEFNNRGFFIRTTGAPFANMRYYTTLVNDYLIEIMVDARDYDNNLELLDAESDDLISRIIIEEKQTTQ